MKIRVSSGMFTKHSQNSSVNLRFVYAPHGIVNMGVIITSWNRKYRIVVICKTFFTRHTMKAFQTWNTD